MGIETDMSVPTNSFEKARMSMELSRQKVYAERAHKSRSIFMYSAGAVRRLIHRAPLPAERPR